MEAAMVDLTVSVMRGFLDRMMQPRDLVLRFNRVSDPANLTGVTGILTTSQALKAGDLDRVRSLDVRELVDGQIVRIPREGATRDESSLQLAFFMHLHDGPESRPRIENGR
jgi:hypothetical protein